MTTKPADAAPAPDGCVDKRNTWMQCEDPKRSHRRDIDGLRTLAVLPVVAFHAGFHTARGGFVGVDVFFVISGFLITQLIFDEIRGDRFSIVNFYERRIRRILPALLAVLVAVFITGLVFCAPREMVNLSKSAIAAGLSVSNFYFWLGESYFDGGAINKPLLHTWSLAVEEQFYLFWPIFLIVGHRFFRGRLLLVTGLISVLSFIISAIGAVKFPDATFYLPLTRFWELSLGGALALGVVPWTLGPKVRSALAAAGLLLIGLSVYFIESTMPFPGILALPPCLGAAMIILAGRDGETLIGKGLSQRPMVFVGIISYSLYLWSWPITVFQRNYLFLMGGLSEPANKLLIVGASLVAAYLSWKYIETPFRSGSWRPSANRLFQMAIAGSAAIVAFGVLCCYDGGLPERFSQRELQAAAYLDYDARDAFRFGHCFLSTPLQQWKLDPACLTVSDSKRNVLLLGDSHAADLWYGLNATFKDVNFLQATAAGCLPTVTHRFNESSKCTDVIDYVYQSFLSHHHIDCVLLSARWRADSLGKLTETIRWFSAHKIPVALIGPSAQYDSPVPRLLFSAIHSSDPNLPQRHRDESIRSLDAQFRELAQAEGVDFISMIDVFCTNASCAVADATGSPLLYDAEHFTADGSVFAATRLPALQHVVTQGPLKFLMGLVDASGQLK